MKSTRGQFLASFWPALILLAGLPLANAGAQGPATVARTIHSYAWGDRTYTALAIDGGVVPLITPPTSGTHIRGGDGVTITWPGDDAIARIRGASKPEAGLLDMMGTPDAPDAWKKYIASTLHDHRYTFQVHDFQPDVLDVNHWRIGAISMDYSLGGLKSSSLLMIWRCLDGSTLAVTLQSGAGTFKAHSQELFSLIGASLMMKP
jgi:hypothetical protein